MGKEPLSLTINPYTKRLTRQMTINNKALFFEGYVSTENGILTLKHTGIRNLLGDYNNSDLVNTIGPSDFMKLIGQLRDLRIKGGYSEGRFEFERMKPFGAPLKDRPETLSKILNIFYAS
jgi:hypothetical protein